ARRVILVRDAGARIFLWHVARPRPLPSPPAVLSGYEYRCATANAKPLAVVRLLFVHSVLRTDSLSNSSIRCTPQTRTTGITDACYSSIRFLVETKCRID